MQSLYNTSYLQLYKLLTFHDIWERKVLTVTNDCYWNNFEKRNPCWWLSVIANGCYDEVVINFRSHDNNWPTELNNMNLNHRTWATAAPHDKTNKMTCAPSEDSDQPGHPPSLIRVSTVRMKKHWALNYLLSSVKTLIRLGECPGWSESSLSAHHFVGFVMCRLTW